jgi:isopenicillin N synthase-like dioxygenase
VRAEVIIMAAATPDIPSIDISALFGGDGAERRRTDAHIASAAAEEGFMRVTGLPADVPHGPRCRSELLGLFSLPEQEIRKLWRWNFDARNANVYRGWFPAQTDGPTYKEGIDIGPDIVRGESSVDASDPLREATPLPPEVALPGWRAAAADYYRAMERVAAALMQSVARGLGLCETVFDEAFANGNSTLRLIRYPARDRSSLSAQVAKAICVRHDGEEHLLIGRPHCDTGFLTLLAQDGVGGLQARHRDGSWVDVPPDEESLAINFGQVLERWTGGRIRATEHRVVSPGGERFSIPFFYEPGVDAVISPLPLDDVPSFEPFYFGDHLWDLTTHFVEQRGIAHLRRPKGPPTA